MSTKAINFDHLKIFWGGLEQRILELEEKLKKGKRLTKTETLNLREAKWLLAKFPDISSDDHFLPGEPSLDEIEAGKNKFKKGLEKLSKGELIEKLSLTMFELDWLEKTMEHESIAYDFLFESYEDSTKKIISNSKNRKQGKSADGTYHGDRKKLAKNVIKELQNEGSITYRKFCGRMRKYGDFPASTLREYYRSITGLDSTK